MWLEKGLWGGRKRRFGAVLEALYEAQKELEGAEARKGCGDVAKHVDPGMRFEVAMLRSRDVAVAGDIARLLKKYRKALERIERREREREEIEAELGEFGKGI